MPGLSQPQALGPQVLRPRSLAPPPTAVALRAPRLATGGACGLDLNPIPSCFWHCCHLGPSSHHHPPWGYWNGLHTLCLASPFTSLRFPGQEPECPFKTKVGSCRSCSAKRSNGFLPHLLEKPTSSDRLHKSLRFSLTSSSALTCQPHQPRWRPGIQAANSCLRAFELPCPLREVRAPWRCTRFAPLPASVTELKGCSWMPPLSNSTPALPPRPPLLYFPLITT